MKTTTTTTTTTTATTALLLLAATITTLTGCLSDSSDDHDGAAGAEEITATPDGPPRVSAETPASAAAEPRVDVKQLGQEGTTSELVAALEKAAQKPGSDDAQPIYVVVREGADIVVNKLKDTHLVVTAGAEPVGRALRLENTTIVVVELLLNGAPVEVKIPVQDLRYLKTIDLAYLGQETQRVTIVAVSEIDDFDLDEESRRAVAGITQPLSGLNALNDPNAALAPDFDCIARFARISASRDFLPFPLTNCSAPQDPVGDPERIADATQAKKVAQNIFNQQVTAYNNAQAMIAALNARLVSIQNAYIFIRNDPAFKEYNVTHFKDFIHGRKDYNSRYDRAEALLVAAAFAAQAQIAAYSQVPPPNAAIARSDANRIVARKWNCVLKQGLLNNGGRSGTTIVGVSLETVGAPFLDIQVMLDDHPPLPQKDGWGGLFEVGVTANQPSDVTRLPVASFIPITASAGLPIVMFRFQPLDAKKTRPVGKACNLRAGIVL